MAGLAASATLCIILYTGLWYGNPPWGLVPLALGSALLMGTLGLWMGRIWANPKGKKPLSSGPKKTQHGFKDAAEASSGSVALEGPPQAALSEEALQPAEETPAAGVPAESHPPATANSDKT
ncbi:MAG: hypothetical protein SFZ03_10740 [Candidatus Melainabacteria bacterium]|nr:hypothetical protein [Candidatus Melainabacteria bacterium]